MENNIVQAPLKSSHFLFFEVPFFPDYLSFSDFLGLLSVILGIVSIVLSLVIYHLSNLTTEKLAEDAAQRAFDKLNAGIIGEENTSSANEIVQKTICLTGKQKKAIKKILTLIFKKAKRNSINSPWIHAASFPIELKQELDEAETAILLCIWRDKKYISWTGNLEVSTPIRILKGDAIIADINSC